jgi:two-component system nitrogen regulation sensor histidine kinase NtrY
MSLRRKLFGLFAFTVIVSVTAVTWIAFAMTRRAFERADSERASALVAQFRREFNRQGEDVARRVGAVAGGDAATRMATAVSRGEPDYGAFLNDARDAAAVQRLEFLEFLDAQGTIVSSAQAPATFGYKESVPVLPLPKAAFLRQETLPNGPALCLCAARQLVVDSNSLYVVGGIRLDKEFLDGLELPAGSRAMLYANLSSGFSQQALISASPKEGEAEQLEPLIVRAQQPNVGEASAVVHYTPRTADDETVQAISLFGEHSQPLAELLIANSRRAYVELAQQIATAAVLAAIVGLFLAVLFSGWASARVTRPIEQLATAARDIAGGNWSAYVPVTSADEIGQLADAFNHMTHELLEQRDRLMQSERVAAWRELARRLAHELKNPLFPLQLTVENLVRAREQSPEQFEEIFRESTATLLGEISNLKQIISRFSEFSRMPKPQFQPVRLNEVVQNAARLFQAQFSSSDRPAITCKLELAEKMDPVSGDPDLLHRAISNLVLNALDAMPGGGALTLRTRQEETRVIVEVADTGVGITPEESARLFTPYYTSKPHGTGLGLAVAQSIVSDHGGKIRVRSEPGSGTTFVIELPRDEKS